MQWGENNLTWDDYYERFYDLSLSTQKSYSYKLTNYGDAEEVFEVLSEFAFYDKYFATRFASRSVDGGVHFSPDHVLEMTLLIDKPVLSQMAETAEPAFDREQLEEIYMLIDDASFTRISKKQNIDIFADEEQDEKYSDSELEDGGDFVAPSQKKPGFFGTLFAFAAGISLAGGSKGKHHNGRCTGDCANCPPHYGYRYGRWYYGHDHQYGCEFGGNRGSGQTD
ncbi:hypothetical protein [Neglectibacter caecimuris]|uniref:hypothetical protein n=1 Tax=Neglectibacter caecimuris TaxID=3093658 RepID=UPI002AC9CB02|nr:hypothetical protein [Neglectibacter sp. M00184]